jgi:hypothetical protein
MNATAFQWNDFRCGSFAEIEYSLARFRIHSKADTALKADFGGTNPRSGA